MSEVDNTFVRWQCYKWGGYVLSKVAMSLVRWPCQV